MGEYWKPVNVTRREFIHPHHVDCGLKLGEWWEWNGEPVDSRVRRVMQARWSHDDDVRAVSDYGGQRHLFGPMTAAPWPDYYALRETFREICGEEPDAADAVDPVLASSHEPTTREKDS